MVSMESSLYQKEHTPLKKETHATKVMVNISIFLIENFDEKASKFDAKFLLKLKWYILFNFSNFILHQNQGRNRNFAMYWNENHIANIHFVF